MNIQQSTNYVRIIGTSQVEGYEKPTGNIGDIREVMHPDFDCGAVSLFTEGETDYEWFNLHEVRFLTPVYYKGNYIAIGDSVKMGGWCEVIGYNIFEDGINLVIKSGFGDIRLVPQEEIKSHDMSIKREPTKSNKVYEVYISTTNPSANKGGYFDDRKSVEKAVNDFKDIVLKNPEHYGAWDDSWVEVKEIDIDNILD